ncbi:MAG: bifunctional pyr operon transcriptional regulator/uracil phosphoribosyltransferase PyrR [Clostridia bacterium]|nr:bifunctional pyr operon transcriptional regulator/uracil phosphoribosyltransferase PyrR [Clostridia bacterium]
MTVKAKLMDEAAMRRTLVRMSHEIVEKNDTVTELCFLGIHRRGLPLAKELADNVSRFSEIKTRVGSVDITLHRDDRERGQQSEAETKTKIDFPIDNRVVILVDDVICTGRTIRAAMDALVSVGRPAKIQLAVLIDRGHRELPIRGDYVGKNVPTSRKERISVRVTEYDNETGVYVCETDQNN